MNSYRVKIGDRIRILNQNENYDKWVDKIWIVTKISRNTKEHPGYDGCNNEPLVDCEDLPVSLYAWEFEIV